VRLLYGDLPVLIGGEGYAGIALAVRKGVTYGAGAAQVAAYTGYGQFLGGGVGNCVFADAAKQCAAGIAQVPGMLGAMLALAKNRQIVEARVQVTSWNT